uniref:Uncharacterized protein n=1 Tax=Anguilla anguilla TaxID=7936 RepID=A0A0E9UG57_ANGAN
MAKLTMGKAAMNTCPIGAIPCRCTVSRITKISVLPLSWDP